MRKGLEISLVCQTRGELKEGREEKNLFLLPAAESCPNLPSSDGEIEAVPLT